MKTPTRRLALFFAGFSLLIGPLAFGLPEKLSQTGMYVGGDPNRLAPDLIPFAPQFALWTDGLAKRRWIRLPAQTQLKWTGDDSFEFPVGTQMFKEFSYGARVETRVLIKGPTRWEYGTYLWDQNQKDARLVKHDESITVSLGDRIRHRIPSPHACAACHAGGAEMPVGFSPLQLSDQPLRARKQASATLRSLWAAGKLDRIPEQDPKWPARHGVEAYALGYLYANCASCHRPGGRAAQFGMDFRFSFAANTWKELPAFQTVVGKSSGFQIPGVGPETQRIFPGSPQKSSVLHRMSLEGGPQMPPMGRSIADTNGAAWVQRWIEMLPALGQKRAFSRY